MKNKKTKVSLEMDILELESKLSPLADPSPAPGSPDDPLAGPTNDICFKMYGDGKGAEC